jgi:hypothetical protein
MSSGREESFAQRLRQGRPSLAAREGELDHQRQGASDGPAHHSSPLFPRRKTLTEKEMQYNQSEEQTKSNVFRLENNGPLYRKAYINSTIQNMKQSTSTNMY